MTLALSSARGFLRIAWLSCLLGAAVGPLRAQEQPVPKINANIRTLGNLPASLPLCWMNDEQPQAITVYPRELSRKVKYHGPAAIAFYPRGADDAPPAPGTPPAAMCVLPEKSGDYLLVFTPNPDQKTFRVAAIAEDIRGFKEGMFLFLNFSSAHIYGAIENSRFSVNPGKTALMVFPANPNGEIGLMLKMASVDSQEQWKVVYQRPQFYRGHCRWWGFLFDNPRTPEGVDVRIFRDKLPVPPGEVVAPKIPPPPPEDIFNGPQDNPPILN